MYPLHLEKQYETFWSKEFISFSTKALNKIKPVLKQQFDSAKSDSRQDQDIFLFLEQLRTEYGQWIDQTTLEKKLATNLHLLDKWSQVKCEQMIAALQNRLNTPQGSTVTGRPTPSGMTGEKWLTTVNLKNSLSSTYLDRAIKQNVSLINSAYADYYNEISKVISNAVTNGQSYTDITRDLERITGAHSAKCRFWARDQASKFFGQTTRMRQESAGFTGYIWRTTGDGRVRDLHSMLEGTYHEWKKPPMINGKRCHPGDDYNCRCWAEPAFGPEKAQATPRDPLGYMKSSVKNNGDFLTLSSCEDKIRRQNKYESLYVYKENGELVFGKDGAATSVTLTGEEATKIKDCIVTHNHPIGWRFTKDDPRFVGNSFSLEDIALAVCREAKEMRAVTPVQTFSMKPGKKDWNENYFDKVVHPCYCKYNEMVKSMLSEKIDKGEITIEFAESIHFHEIWSKVADELGFVYKREKL